MRRAPLATLLAFLPLAACAHGGAAPDASPPTVAEPPNARARLYADCLADAARTGSYDRFGRYLRLTCTGAPAEALFAAMEPYARPRGHVSLEAGVETRGLTSTTANDRCRSGPAGTSCLIILPVGAFLDPANDTPPPDTKGKPKP